MAYPHIAWTANGNPIAERQYSTGAVLQLSHINSCIAVIARGANRAIAIHLSFADEFGGGFNAAAANQVRYLLWLHGAIGAPDVGIVGDISTFRSPGLAAAFAAMTFGWNVVGENDAEGDYTALMIDGGVTVTHGGVGLGWTV